MLNSRGRWALPAIICCVGLIQLFLNLSLQRDWWFEDDPNIVAFVRAHPNPVDYFLNRDLIRGLSAGRVLTPMQTLSFKLDDLLAPLSPLAAYLHTALSALLTACLLFWVCRRWLSVGASLAVPLLWLFLPSTISVLEFISARQYLEGLTWLLLSLLCGFRAIDAPERKGAVLWLFGAVVAYLLAALSKELYVASGAWPLALLFFHGRARLGRLTAPAIGLTAFGALFYAAYRVWTIGLIGQGFASSQAFLGKYHLFLERYPFMLTGNLMGYILCGLIFLFLVFLMFKKRVSWLICFVFASNLCLLLLTIYPVTKHVVFAYQELGTWHRVVFLLNLFMLFCGCWIMDQIKRPWIGRLVFALAAAAIVHGARIAAVNWDANKKHYREDARFYLEHPDRLLYSELPGAMFLPGVHNLYRPGWSKHFISANKIEKHARQCLDDYYHIWRKTPDGYQPDSRLFPLILSNLERERVPLHRSVPEQELKQRPFGRSAFAFRSDVVQVSTPRATGTETYNLGLAETSNRELQFLLPPISDDARMIVFLVNDHATETKGDVTVFAGNGEIVGKRAIHIDKNGVLQIERGELFSPRDWREGVRISATSAQPLRGCLLIEHATRQIAMIPGQAPSSAELTGSDLGEPMYLAHIPGNRDDWRTCFLASNPTVSPRTAHFRFFSERGEVRTFTRRIPPGHTLTIEAAQFEEEWGDAIQAGSLSFDRPGPLFMTVFNYHRKLAAFVPRGRPSRLLSLPESVEGYFWQGLACFNFGAEATTIQFLNHEGESVHRIDLVSGQKHREMMDPLTDMSVRRIHADQPVSVLIFGENQWGNLEVLELAPIPNP